jgi:hypothetical protein
MREPESMNPSSFAIEEYKAIQDKVKNARDIVTRYETVTMGGAVVAPAVLLGIGTTTANPVPLVAWWSIVLMLSFAAVRCWSYYLYIAGLQAYVAEVEGHMRREGYKLSGFETAKRKKLLGPLIGHVANIVIWLGMLGIVSLLALWKTLGYQIL